jgi:stage V sporulation protein B
MIYAVFAAAVLLRFGGTIGELLGGGELAGGLISAIAPVVPFIYMEIVLEALIKGMGLQGFSSLNYLAEYVIRISAVLILVPRIGFLGIAVSYYASNVFGNISRLVKILRHTGVRFAPVRMLLSPVLYAVLTCFTAELLCRPLPLAEEGVGYMAAMTALWLIGYSGIFGLLVIFRVNAAKNDKSLVLNIQRLTQKVM